MPGHGLESVNGKALEYAFVKAFGEIFPHGRISSEDRVNTLRSGYNACQESLRSRFFAAATAYFNQLNLKFSGDSRHPAELKLYSDQDGQAFGVRDFTIRLGTITQNVSLKHNHYALKHPRIPSFMQSLGVQKGLEEDLLYRNNYQLLLNTIWDNLKLAGCSLESFQSLGELKSTVLYDRVMAFLYEVLSANTTNTARVRHLHSFLSGGDHLKLIVKKAKIEVYDMQLLSMPSTLTVSRDPNRPAYLFITFSSGLKVHYRVKNDSNALKLRSPALKLDVQPESELPLVDTIPY